MKLRATSVLFAVLIFAASSSGAELVTSPSEYRQAAAIRIGKKAVALNDNALSFVRNRDGEIVDLWVFFTDKQVVDRAGFEAQAASILSQMSEKVRGRRAKQGLDDVLFSDLPIVGEYVNQVTALGAKFRHSSRWLNAASFSIPVETIDQVAQLPFVAFMRPVAKYNRSEPLVAPEDLTPSDNLDVSRTLEYGASAGQLLQINVDYAHDQGFAGAGVTLAIFDTGYRKTHEAFTKHYMDGRVLAEYDFVFGDNNTANEAEDVADQWDHGTYIWSTSAGYKFGQQVGPAYLANFILCKTEDLRSETPAEEDNWLAAAEWVDSLGADVITSSLTYSDWYNYSQYDGETATITIAANTAASVGILVCNAMGNSGPSAGTLFPPSDAFDILACGAVNSGGAIASFSSRGPTADGRIKPEVVAQGVSTAAATTDSDVSYGAANGTSLSTPLVAGAACLLIEARPNFPVTLIRTALMESATNAASPNNTFGWGLVDMEAALNWGANFSADITFGDAPMTVQFTDLSTIPVNSYDWDFGDGQSSSDPNPAHQYVQPGAYSVSLTIDTEYGPITNLKQSFVIAKADTMAFVSDSAWAGDDVVLSVHLTNSMPTERITVPLQFEDIPAMTLDSMQLGERTSYFERLRFLTLSPADNRYTPDLTADIGGGSPPLAPGSGEILKLFFSMDAHALGGLSNIVDSTTNFAYRISVATDIVNFVPDFHSGAISTRWVVRGDFNGSGAIDISDITAFVAYLYQLQSPPVTIQSADATADATINISDLTFMVDFLFAGGPAPQSP